MIKKRCIIFIVFVVLSFSDVFGMGSAPPESDPVFTESPASRITQELIDNLSTFTAINFTDEEKEVLSSISLNDVINIKLLPDLMEKLPALIEETVKTEVANITFSDVSTLVEETIKTEIANSTFSEHTIPIQSNPPENPTIGNAYINNRSGVFCRYLCDMWTVPVFCDWTAASKLLKEDIFNLAPCAAETIEVSGIPPVIKTYYYLFPEHFDTEGKQEIFFFPEPILTNPASVDKKIIDVQKCSNPFNYKGMCSFTINLTDEDEPRNPDADIYNTKAKVYITKLSNALDTPESEWNLKAERIPFFDNNSYLLTTNGFCQKKPCFKYIHQFRIYYNKFQKNPGTISPGYSWENGVPDTIIFKLEKGLYGFFIEAKDYTNNIVVYGLLPLILRYDPDFVI